MSVIGGKAIGGLGSRIEVAEKIGGREVIAGGGRPLIGALLAVGEGRQQPVEWPASLLRAITRFSTVVVAPLHGLPLLGVDYPPDDELAARVEHPERASTTA